MVSSKQSSSTNKKTPVRSPEEIAILTTLAYSSLFSFPMNKDELWQYLISNSPIDRKLFDHSLKTLTQHITVRDGYYILKGHEENIRRRMLYVHEVSSKYARASKVASILSYITTIEFIGVSGGLAAKNVSPEDDIDLFIIVKKDKVFITRFWIVCVLQFLGLRRKRKQQKAPNKICVNLIIDTASIVWQPSQQDVYTAREIAQVQPLYERNDIYQLFLHMNKWVTAFLPNAYESKKTVEFSHKKRETLTQIVSFIMTSRPLEIIMRFMQKALIARHKTNEIVTNHTLAFHPNDYRAETLRRLKLKMRQLGLLTKV